MSALRRCRDSRVPMRVAFQMLGDRQWVAGENYLRNLFHAMHESATDKAQLCLVSFNGRQHEEFARSLGADGLISYQALSPCTPAGAINGAFKRLLLTDRAGGKFLEQNGVDVLFGRTLLHKYPRVGTLSWLPDLQHIHFPDLFTAEERALRNETYRQSAISSSRVILPCRAAGDDFKKLMPEYGGKVRTTHPVADIPATIYNKDPHAILDIYHLPEKFIYLPNQFWQHKNHETLFEALAILKRRQGLEVPVVCTGYPGDYRKAGYFASLCEKISQWNLREQFIYLGVVPREHVLLLMRQCVSVLNPSLFEGWGMSVDEARSLGKQVIVSDIAAHREQNPPKAIFFDPKNRDELAEKLREVWQVSKPGPDFELEAEARVSLPSRLAAFAGTFLAYCREVYEEVHS